MIKMYSYYDKERISQGDIFEDIKIPIGVEVVDGKTYEIKRKFPYVVVMTQDCDLEQDFNNREQNSDNQRNRILSILLCPVFIASELQEGDHLENVKLEMDRLNSTLWHPIKKNKDERYYFLDEEEVIIGDDPNRIVSVPDLVIDFKHYQTIQRDDLYDQYNAHYYVSTEPLFRERISDRFTHYLGRIGLPEKDGNLPGYACGVCGNPEDEIIKLEK